MWLKSLPALFSHTSVGEAWEQGQMQTHQDSEQTENAHSAGPPQRRTLGKWETSEA